MIKNKNYTSWIVAGLALIALIIGCSSSTGPDFTLPITVSAKLGQIASASNVDYVVLTVTQEDNIILVDTSDFTDGVFERVVDIPPGSNINFSLSAYSADDVLLYSGSNSVDVGLGEDISLEIQMIPQILMLKVDPLYQSFSSLAGGEHFFDIYIYNAESLFGASFRINYANNIISPTRVEFNSGAITNFLGTEVLAFSRFESGYIAMSVVKLRGQTPQSGAGHLARVYYTLLSEGSTDLEFNIETVSLIDDNENPISNSSSIILENGRLTVAVQ